ncbi:MAG: TIGR04086 family membrane protein [Clostridia bacterium]|nr:TIGR04086 family membrane protein [Clostridia bacterium]
MEKIKRYSISLLISFVLAAVFLTISASIFAYTNINDRYLDSFVFGTVMLSVLIGAIILARKIKEKGIIYGGLFGLLFCLIVYFITCIEYTGLFISNTLFIYLGISFLSGIVGGIIGVNV